MPNTATYIAAFRLGNFDTTDGSYDWGTYLPIGAGIGDDPNDGYLGDGSSGDGIEYGGDSLFWAAVGRAVTYTGYTVNGEPIIYDSFDNYHYLLSNDNNGYAAIGAGSGTPGIYVYCFCRHTSIGTPAGPRPVESLRIGDPVTTAEGRHVPVKWIGRQSRHPLFAGMHGQLPVVIKAGALGEGLPVRDLYVSPDHAMLVDGVLVHARALVNEVSIVQMKEWAQGNVEYFHIELENHELILAEGAPAETFVDNVSRRAFDNHAEYEWLYGDGSVISELPFPRVKTRRQLSSRTRSRLMEIAMASLLAAA